MSDLEAALLPMKTGFLETRFPRPVGDMSGFTDSMWLRFVCNCMCVTLHVCQAHGGTGCPPFYLIDKLSICGVRQLIKDVR